MSWVEPENGGGEDVTENPDPEEDSDLPIRPRDRDNDGEGVRSEQDRPEDDLAIAPEEATTAEVATENQVFNSESINNEQRTSPGNEEETGACVESKPVGQIENAEDEVGVCSSNLESEEVVVCNNMQKNVSDNFEREGGIAEYDTAPESCLAGRVDILMEARPLPEDMAAVGERSEEENSNRKADNEEGPEGEDSFEQDEETAAPECENEVRQDSTSESDRQPIHSHIHVTENVPSLALTNGVPPILPSCPSPVSRNREEDLSHLRSENAISPDVSGTSVGGSGMNFSGNVEISGTAEDAPEAELDNFHSTSLPLRGSAPSVLNVEYGHAACEFLPQALDSRCSEAPTSGISINHSNLEHLPDAGNDHDMQAPECDRENSPQPPPNIDESNSIGESVQLEAVSFEQTVNDNQAASLSGHEAISLSSANACQQLNTCESSIKGAQNEHSSTNNANLRSDFAHMSQERKLTLSQGANEEKCEANEQSDAMLRNPCVQESFECSSGQSTTIQAGLSLSAHCNNSRDSSPQDKIMTSASSDLYPPKVTSPVASGQNVKPPPSSSPTTLPGEKVSLTSRENPSRHSEFSIPNMPDNNIPNAARQKEDPQKRPSNSSSSSSSNTSQRTSPAKAVAAALFHVMGMDSKFTGRDLALALQSDDEEDLMSELDAELLSSSASSISKANPQKQETKVQLQRQSKSKTKSVSKSDSGQSLNGLPSTTDVQQLQEHNRQLLEQLRIRDEEIARLSREPKLIPQSEQAAAEKDTSSHSPDDLYLPQIKELEKTIAQQGAEIKSLTEKLYTHDAAAKRTVLSLQNEMKSRVDQATKMYDECRKEKDVIVVKFAEAEAKNMEAKRFVEKSETKIRDALRERENMASGLKAARADRQKVVANYDAKCAEVSNLHKELEKMKEALNSGEYRIKWFQNKLKDELEAHKETKANLEKTNLRLKEAREETELIRKECQAIVKRYQESEEIKSNTLEKDLKLKESELQTHLQERNDSQELHQMLKQELESLKSQHKDTIEEAKTLRDKVKCLEEERQQNHGMIENYQEIMQKQKSDNTDLTSKLNALATLEDDYRRAQNMIQSLDKDIADLKVSNRDLLKEMDSCRERESKMLTLQSELSKANAMLRSENTNLSNKASTLSSEVDKMKTEIQQLHQQVKELTETLEAQNTKHKENTEHLVLSLSQKTKESSDFKQKWEDEMDNSKTLKRRHANNIKDLTRQLQQARRKLEAHDGKGDGGSMGSRTNSNGSLNSVDNSQQQQHQQQQHNHHQQAPPLTSPQEFPVITEQVEVDKNVLIERIVRLQKSHARKNEKLEFLGEHIQQLLVEIKKKTKIIQTYALREEAGTLSSDDMDAHKTLLAKKGGIMASVYSVHQQDGSMTLDLSLQINKKLQAVLEDTLLKNITLKENLDTLGEEIARLSQENRRLQLHLQDLEKQPS